MTSVYEKKVSVELRLIHAEQMSSELYNFIVKKAIDIAEDWGTEAIHFKLMGTYGFF